MDDLRYAVDLGVKGKFSFVDFLIFSFPESVLFDVMHLVFLGFIWDFYGLLYDKFFKNILLNDHPGRMIEKDWVDLGIDMSNIEVSGLWRRYPRNIEKYINDFKAEELSNFLLHYLLSLSFNWVNASMFRAFQWLIFVISVMISYEITITEIDEIEKHLILFTRWYYDIFYQGKYEWLSVCKYIIYDMLHLLHDIWNWGSVCYY